MQITELAAKLQSLGLSDKESKVYVAALFLGPSSVQRIAEQADVNRATAYVILDQLFDLGLVSQSTEGKKTVYIAEGPEALSRLLDRQEQAVKAKRTELVELLPELEQSHRAPDDKAPVVRFYKGPRGAYEISDYLRKKAKPKSVIYNLMNIDEVEKIAPGNTKANPSRRLKKQISSKVIFSSNSDLVLTTDPKLLREAVRIEEPVIADIDLYEDRAALITYEGKETVGILIESPPIVRALRQLFELAWNNTKK